MANMVIGWFCLFKPRTSKSPSPGQYLTKTCFKFGFKLLWWWSYSRAVSLILYVWFDDPTRIFKTELSKFEISLKVLCSVF